MNIIYKIKLNLKKYLPKRIYFFIYKNWRICMSFFETDKEKVKLINFTNPIFKNVTLDDISFDILINPENGSLDKSIFLHGLYEPHILRIIREHINSDSICIDVGGNIGQHSIFMSKVATNGSVHVFEPLNRLTKQIQDSLNKNNIKNIIINNIALSDTEGLMQINTNSFNIGMSTLIVENNFTGNEMVQVKVFDDIWKGKKVDFIKIDVEGFEYNVLKGMKKTIELFHPTIVMEFSPLLYKKIGLESQEVLNFLFKYGYRIYDIDYGNIEIFPEDIEIFLKRITGQTNILVKQSIYSL